MRLGATIADYLASSDPEVHVAECRKHGYRSAPCPEVSIEQGGRIRAIKRAFDDADLVIAEVPAWVNPLDPDERKRRANLDTIAQRLALADELDAVCCPTVAGSYNDSDESDSHAGHHPKNFTTEAFDAVVQWVRAVLDQVNPRRTKLTLEICPWTTLDGPQAYLDLIEAVGHPGLAVHLDPANCVCDPRTYYGTPAMINRCFDLLGARIRSCHAKDVHYTLDARTVGIKEVVPGRGVLDYRTFLRRIGQLSSETPLIIEHLSGEREFNEAAGFIKQVARQVGVSL
jgi:sugar phosphate isomerase/epimerase